MSLTFFLYKAEPAREQKCICARCGTEHVSREVRSKRFVFEANITNNLVPMAEEVALYLPLWRPRDLAKTAGELLQWIQPGLKRLRTEDLSRFNAPNGWGKQADFLRFVEDVLRACEAHPDCAPEGWG